MLVQLSIRDIVLIEQLELVFSDSLSVLTGETGAGKSILLDALSLALGARGDGNLVRNGAQQGQVSAVFDLPPGHFALSHCAEKGIEVDGYLILRRQQAADGRSKAFVNDQPVSVGFMRELGMALVELHGQHDERALLSAASHRQLLDAFGGLESEVEALEALWREWRGLQKSLLGLRADIEKARKEEEFLKASTAELSVLAPEEGEETLLADKRQKMMKSEKIAGDLDDAVSILSGDASPVPVLANLAKRLERKAEEFPDFVKEAIGHLDRSLDSLQHAQQQLEQALRQCEFDPGELESAEERLFALRAASRKYSVPVEGLADLAVRLGDDLDKLNLGEEKLAEMEAGVSKAEQVYLKAAQKLSAKRAEAANQLKAQVETEFPALKLDEAEFIIRHESETDKAGSQGIDEIEFWIKTNPGTKPGPMTKIASGGELSRLLLALKVALADRGSAPTLVFDEIDTGIGGAVADAIGKRLLRLAEKVQVLSVTHAPQVAARAASHFVISKSLTAGPGEQPNDIKKGEAKTRTATRINAVDDGDRLEEIARMLAGSSITDEARAAARSLLKGN